MYREHSVGVVVPAYNEAGFVGEVIETLPSFVDRIYAIDDRSTDGTWAEIQRAAGVDPDSSAGDTGAKAPRADGAGTHDVGDDRSDERPSARSGSGADEAAGDAAEDAAAGTAGGETDVGTPSGGGENGDGTPSGGGENGDGTPSAGIGDGSTSAAEDSAESDRVVPIRHEENRGVGGAIKTGYQHARADEMDVTVVVGGDGQMDPDVMERLLDPIVEGKADYAKGNRLLDPDHHEDMPRHRVFGNGVLTLLTKIATGYWQVGDPQMGYTAISLDAMEAAVVDDMYEYYGYCNDLLVRLSTAGYRVADVPCPLDYGDEQSHITYREYVPRVSSMLLGSFLRRLWSGKGSVTGASRLGLFVGGAAAVALGIVGWLVAGALRAVRGGVPSCSGLLSRDGSASDDRASSDDVQVDGADQADGIEFPAGDAAEHTAGDDRRDGEPVAIEITDADAEDEAAQSGAGGCRSTLAVVGGVASLLAAMLVDATANATKNYTDRLSDDDRE